MDSFLYKTVKGNLNWYLVDTAGIKTVSYSRYGLNLGGLNTHLTLRWRGTIFMLNTSERKGKLFGKTEYVVGFAFDENEKNVILVRKQRPEWQKGALNGPGGHIEDGESMLVAMAREFKEEVGIETNPYVWRHKVTIQGNGWRVYFLSLKLTDKVFYSARSVTDELVTFVNMNELFKFTMIQNLRWLIPYCQYKSDLEEKVTYIGE